MKTSCCTLRFALGGVLVAPSLALAQSPAAPTTQEVPPSLPALSPAVPPAKPEPPSSTAPPAAAETPPTAASGSVEAPGTEPPPAATEPPKETNATSPAGTNSAQASAPIVSTAPTQQRSAAEQPSVHEHDGFFVRISSGFSAWGEAMRSDDSEVYGGEIRGRSTGIATVGDLTIGGTPWKGVVVAAALHNTSLLASTFRLTEESAAAPPRELDPNLRQLNSIGPTVIWFPNPKGGFNLAAGVGLAILTPLDAASSNSDDGERYRALGLSLTLEIGQQFWIAEQWAVGVRGRFLGAIADGKDSTDTTFGHAISASPGVVFDVTYH